MSFFSLKAETAEEKLAKTMFLPLAERMSQKYVTDGKIEAEAGTILTFMQIRYLGAKTRVYDTDMFKRNISLSTT